MVDTVINYRILEESFNQKNSEFNEETLKVIEEDENENVFGVYENFEDFLKEIDYV